MKNTKSAKLWQHVKYHGSITTWDAIRIARYTRAAAWIAWLEKKGINVEHIKEYDGKGGEYTRYYISAGEVKKAEENKWVNY